MKILFVCHGNICRSPMAEFVLNDTARKLGLGDKIHADSAATSTEEIGNPVHPGTRKKLQELGISCTGKTARQLTKADYSRYPPDCRRRPGGKNLPFIVVHRYSRRSGRSLVHREF